MTALPRENTEAELDAFWKLCERLAGFDDELCAPYVDGFLTALAVGPLRLAPEQWLEPLFGDAFERACADPDDRANALRTLGDRLAVIHDELDAEALLDDPEALRLNPQFDEWSDEQQSIAQAARAALGEEAAAGDAAPLQDGMLWAEGVLEGLRRLVPMWDLRGAAALDESLGEIVEHVAALVHPPGSDEMQAFVNRWYEGRLAPSRDDLLAEACFALQDLRVLLLDHGPRPDPLRAEVRPGRNDPCPCGSGRKYKKCHGATA